MTEQIKRSRLAANANALIKNRCNSGISWGTNAYPAYSDPAWFADTTAGVNATFQTESFEGGDADINNVINILKYVTGFFSAIRTTRIVIYMSHYSLGQTVVSDQTAVANLIGYASTGNPANEIVYPIGRGSEMDLDQFNAVCDAIWNKYVQMNRNTVATLTNTICHTSCHTSCHTNRGRR